MCGIIGIISNAPVGDRILSGLKRLEYRGYDSSGIATLDEKGAIACRRAVGKIAQLQQLVAASPASGTIGIGHTRWATHGAPDERNAHPHSNGRISVVHNGIIENYVALRGELLQKGHVFTSETDTESILHLIADFMDQGFSPQEALFKTLHRLEGAFAIAVLFSGHNLLMGARRGSPLVVGVGDGEMFLGSDALGLAPFTDQMVYLHDGDWSVLTQDSYQVYDASGACVDRGSVRVPTGNLHIAKNGFAHFMLKEIHEQPAVIGDTLSNFLDPMTRLPDFSRLHLPAIQHGTQVNIIACGTSYYAAMVAKYWIESMAGLQVNVDIASEFRYRHTPFQTGGMAIFVSQSGETADTLAALAHAKRHGQFCIAVVNVAESSMARMANAVILTDAGVEIGVASTKAFTCQLTLFAALSLYMAHQLNRMDSGEISAVMDALTHVPTWVQEMLGQSDVFLNIAKAALIQAQDILYIGRGSCYPIALEGALKLKELSYIHAEGFPAGELKHGPIALVDRHVPVIVLAPSDGLFDKTLSNAHEVAARGARVILLSDAEGCARVADHAGGASGDGDTKNTAAHPSGEVLSSKAASSFITLTMPTVHPTVAPLIYAIPMQLLAYFTAVLKGTDVDQPRNLAKSVTVE